MLQNDEAISVLHQLFQLCFDSGKIPDVWRRAIISPIPKDTTKDNRIPLNYRGISLQSSVAKLYSALLNSRLLCYLEDNNILVDEQNGFRRNRSCQDHIFVLSSILRNRLVNGLSTFVTFIDLKKAFDYVNRDSLMYKLLVNGVDGKMYNSIKAMYHNTNACVKINSLYTDWFETNIGVRQGDNFV